MSTRGSLPNIARAALQMLQLEASDSSALLESMQSHLSSISRDEGGERWEKVMLLSTGIHAYSGMKRSIEYVQQCVAVVGSQFNASSYRNSLSTSCSLMH